MAYWLRIRGRAAERGFALNSRRLYLPLCALLIAHAHSVLAGCDGFGGSGGDCGGSVTPDGSLIIPEVYPDGQPVTSIAPGAFEAAHHLISVTIPNTVTNIGDRAFASCENLRTVSIGNNVQRIGVSAFDGSYALTSISIPNSVTSVEDRAFAFCFNVTAISFGVGVTNIGKHAFFSCTAVTSLKLPGNLRSLGSMAFGGCNMRSISLPASVESVGTTPFIGCDQLSLIGVNSLNANFGSLDGVLYNRAMTVLIQCPAKIAGDAYSIPESVITIGGGAFFDCRSLARIAIPASVTRIEDRAFYSCNSLSSVTLPKAVKGIGNSTFFACTSLTNVVFGDRIERIGESAFEYCQQLARISLPDSVVEVGTSAFANCSALREVTVGHGATNIETRAFFRCDKLGSVHLGSPQVSIGIEAFLGCNGLTNVTFKGNAPSPELTASGLSSTPAIVHYLPGTMGWGPTLDGQPTSPWFLPAPTILSSGPRFGVRDGGFGFRISWATNAAVVIEASGDVAAPTWPAVATNLLTGGWCDFDDPDWAGRPGRVYRVRPL